VEEADSQMSRNEWFYPPEWSLSGAYSTLRKLIPYPFVAEMCVHHGKPSYHIKVTVYGADYIADRMCGKSLQDDILSQVSVNTVSVSWGGVKTPPAKKLGVRYVIVT
jgi:hypothetical protein